MALSRKEKNEIRIKIGEKLEDIEKSDLSRKERNEIRITIGELLEKLDEAIDLNPETAAENEKLTRLKNGEYDSQAPAEFIRILREIVDEINDIEPIKPPTIRYISDRLKKA